MGFGPLRTALKDFGDLDLAAGRLGAIAVLHVGETHHHREQHADGVGQQVALAPDDLLARIVAGRIDRKASFCAAFAV